MSNGTNISVSAVSTKLKFHQLAELFRKMIVEGQYKNDQKLPTEIELAEYYNLSRPTVAKALDVLRREGLIVRKSGIGTFVRFQPQTTVNNFGLLVPGLGETEIFASICRHLSHLSHVNNFNLIWSGSMQESAATRQSHIEQLANQYVEQGINGVFFAPLELTSAKDSVNHNIVRLFDRADIPVVLMDRDIVSFPSRSPYDLVGVDNFRLAYVMTQHLLAQGCKTVKFIARPYSAPTVQMRIFGYQQALRDAGTPNTPADILIEENYTPEFLKKLLDNVDQPGVFCANDTTASHLMHALTEEGYRIPEQVKVVGVDDVKYANYLRVPLTTYKQPCKEIAKAAVNLMLRRMANPHTKARTVYLDGEIVIRKSTLST